MEASDTSGAGGEKLRLKIVAGNAAGDTVEVEDELVIGRQAVGAGSLANDIEISRQHAVIRAEADGRFVIEDLGSTNGTYVNGRRVDAPLALEVGDRIEVGASALVVQVGAIQPTPASSDTVAPTTSSALPGDAEVAEAGGAGGVADPVPDPLQPIATPEVEPPGEPDVGPAEMGAPEPEPEPEPVAEPEPAAEGEPAAVEPATAAVATPADVPPFSLRIDVDPVAGRATVGLDGESDAVELVLTDGRWRLA